MALRLGRLESPLLGIWISLVRESGDQVLDYRLADRSGIDGLTSRLFFENRT
jgi:hypothetical protein